MLALLSCLAIALGAVAQTPLLFSPIENRDGNACIRSIIRLTDGRMAFATLDGIDIFDGSGFSHHAKVTGDLLPLSKYEGFHHLYLSNSGNLLWIKNYHELQCLNLETGLFISDMPALMTELGFPSNIDDFFCDQGNRIWAITGNKLIQPESGINITLEKGNPILDLTSDLKKLYLFTKNGKLTAYSLTSGKQLYSVDTYPEDENWKFSGTSLVIEGKDGYYQIRNGKIGGFFHFNPTTRKWNKILESNLCLNTIAVDDSCAYISTNNGLITVNISSFKASHTPFILTESGHLLASEISTIATDDSHGIWLGLLNRGILYYHPNAFRYLEIPKSNTVSTKGSLPSSVFSENQDQTVTIFQPPNNLRVSLSNGFVRQVNTLPQTTLTGEYGSNESFIASDGSIFFNEGSRYAVFLKNNSPKDHCSVKPILHSILINGEEIETLGSYDGNTILDKAIAKTTSIVLLPHQNFLTLKISAPQYSPSIPYFAYILDGIDREWHVAKGEGATGRMLSAYYTALPPGNYTFKVRDASSENNPETRIAIKVLPHWWQTGWATTLFILSFLLAVAAIAISYVHYSNKKIAREQRESFLLERIRNLVIQIDRFKAEAPDEPDKTSHHNNVNEQNEKENQEKALSDTDKAFVNKAIEAVEKNLNTPGYSVVQLSQDLCMDRTGLYRKLTALLDQSPSIFIRDIRLRNAARLLKENKLSITEIAEQTGFSSTSYMSKCFQERYGCRPSEYTSKNQDARPEA